MKDAATDDRLLGKIVARETISVEWNAEVRVAVANKVGTAAVSDRLEAVVAIQFFEQSIPTATESSKSLRYKILQKRF